VTRNVTAAWHAWITRLVKYFPVTAIVNFHCRWPRGGRLSCPLNSPSRNRRRDRPFSRLRGSTMYRCIDIRDLGESRADSTLEISISLAAKSGRRDSPGHRLKGAPARCPSPPSPPSLSPAVDYITDKKIAAPTGSTVMSIARLDRMFHDFSDNDTPDTLPESSSD